MDEVSTRRSAQAGVSRLWMFVVFLIFGLWFALVMISSGPSAIRPDEATVVDPLLRPRLEILANIVDASPDDLGPREDLGQAYESNELYESAAATWRQLVELDPDSWIWPYRLAMTVERQGHLDEAIEWMARSVDQSPDDVMESRWRLAHWLIDAGRIRESDVLLSKLDGAAPGSLPIQFAQARLALSQGDAPQAEDLIRRFDLVSSSSGGYGWHLLARALRHQGRLEEAQEAWMQVDHVRPRYEDRFSKEAAAAVGSLRSLQQAAGAQADLGRWQNVLQTTSRVLTIEPEDLASRKLHARAQLELGQFEAAEAEFNSLLLEAPDVSIYSSLATARLMLHEQGADSNLLQDAMQATNAGLELDPQNPELLDLQKQLESMLSRSMEQTGAE